MSKLTIDSELCKKCGTCVRTCPKTVFFRNGKDSLPELVHEELCISCGHCVAICPPGAISHRDFPKGTIIAINREMLPSQDQFFEMIRTRRSRRAFKDNPVEKELIENIIDTARFAPSGHNVQSTEFTVVQNKDMLDKINEMTVSILSKYAKQFRNPILKSLLLMVAKDEVEGALHLLPDFDKIVADYQNGKDTVLFGAQTLIFFHAAKNINLSDVNASLALENASLATHQLGLGSFYAGYVVSACKRDKRIPELISLPSDHKIYGALALGYPKFQYSNWIEKRPAEIRWL